MTVRRVLAVLAVIALTGTIRTVAASAATPGEVTTYPVQACSNLLSAPEGVLVRLCEESGYPAEPAVVNVLPDGTVTSRAVPAKGSSLIATGPSGELWLGIDEGGPIAREAQTVDRVASDGAVQAFPVPQAPGSEQVYFHGLVIDGSGTAWAAIGYEKDEGFFPGTTEGGLLLRISPDGQAKIFTLPHRLYPLGLVVGPEGSIWFTASTGRFVGEHTYDAGVGFIGRLDSSGNLALFRVPVQGGEPAAIAVGPDGKLWFSESLRGAIGTIAPDGTFGRRYPIRDWGPEGNLVFGHEGDLWTAVGGGGVLRMTPWGQQTLFLGESSGVAIGSDGDIWSRESAYAAPPDIERLVPGAPGIDVRRVTGRMSTGSIGLLLACGGSSSACEGTLEVEMETPILYRRSHRGDPGARALRLAQLPYSVPPESQALVRIPVSARALAFTSLYRHREVREGVPIKAQATVTGGPSLKRELRARLGTRPELTR